MCVVAHVQAICSHPVITAGFQCSAALLTDNTQHFGAAVAVTGFPRIGLGPIMIMLADRHRLQLLH